MCPPPSSPNPPTHPTPSEADDSTESCQKFLWFCGVKTGPVRANFLGGGEGRAGCHLFSVKWIHCGQSALGHVITSSDDREGLRKSGTETKKAGTQLLGIGRDKFQIAVYSSVLYACIMTPKALTDICSFVSAVGHFAR